MASVGHHRGRLYLDCRYQGQRHRAYTALPDSPTNRRYMQRVRRTVETTIQTGTFNPATTLPQHPQARKRDGDRSFRAFAETWFADRAPEWRPSHAASVQAIINTHLVLTFGATTLDAIDRERVYAFRRGLLDVGIGPARVNHIFSVLRMILTEAELRFGIDNPMQGMKSLPVSTSPITPFSPEEVATFLDHVRPDFRDYYAVRFFTGLRTAEIDGLRWAHVDLAHRRIRIREAVIDCRPAPLKNASAERVVDLATPALQALTRQHRATGQGDYVFPSGNGQPLRHRNVTARIWHPALKAAGLEKRTPYQTRHTYATWMLACGEQPEYVARQMGHANTAMLFRIYSNFLPHANGRDGAAFEQLLGAELPNPGGIQ